jgi:hypothetical protein
VSAAGVGAGEGSASGLAARGQGGTESLARAVFVALVLGCIGAFFLTQHLKHTPTVLQEFRLTPFFSPYPGGPQPDEAISFKIEHREAVTVAIIDTAGNTVATLVRDRTLERYKTFSLRWDGRRGTARRYEHLESATGRPILLALSPGAIAPAGEYRIEVTLHRAHKTVRSSRSFTLVAGK